MVHDAEHGAVRAMISQTGVAQIALPATEVYLADHALAEKIRRISFFDNSYELVTQHARIAHIALGYFDVRVANAGELDPNERFSRPP
jgi:hypothetical protein